jgi:Spy/CpxP family protein refolding chaperone
MQGMGAGGKWLWAILIVSLCFNVGFGATFAVRTFRPPAGDAVDGGPAAPPGPTGQLHLTPEQKERLAESRKILQQKVETLRKSLTDEQEALVDLLAAPEPDRAAIRARLETIASFQRETQERVIDNLLEEKRQIPASEQKILNETIRCRVCPGCWRAPGSPNGGCQRHGGPGGRGRGGNGRGGP